MPMRALYLLFFLCLLFASGAHAQQHFAYTGNCAQARKAALALQPKLFKLFLEAERKQNPRNLCLNYLSEFNDCIGLLFSGSEKSYKAWKPASDKCLNALTETETTPELQAYFIAEMLFRRSLVFARFGDNFKAATEFRASCSALKKCKKAFPACRETAVLGGIQEAIAGAVPDQYKWIAEILGVKGNIASGIAQLRQYVQTQRNGIAREEAVLAHAYLKFYLQSDAKQVLQMLQDRTYFDEDQNLMRYFLKANLLLNGRQAEKAAMVLSSAENVEGFEQHPIFVYEQAEAHLLQGDASAEKLYKQFAASTQGADFVKDAWLKCAWCALLRDDEPEAARCIAQIKKTGKTNTDADKAAQRFAEANKFPFKPLLRIRLLIDGGNYALALKKLTEINKRSLPDKVALTEYYFRYGRVFEELQQHENALTFYNACIAEGKNEKEYFAARAALQKGFIYEKLNAPERAKAAFNECLSMRNHDLQSSTDRLAKAGLNRVSR